MKDIMENRYFQIERDTHYGGFEYGVSSKVIDLSIEEYEELKSMLISGIGTMEQMRRDNIEKWYTNTGEDE